MGFCPIGLVYPGRGKTLLGARTQVIINTCKLPRVPGKVTTEKLVVRQGITGVAW